MKNKIVQSFLATTKIPETPTHTVEHIMDYLTAPAQVNRMIVCTELGLPALTGVVKGLEEKFAGSDFPLNHDGPHSNSANRRNIGWMIKYIMREYGYLPLQQDASARIGSFSGSKYFTTAARYEKVIADPKYKILVTDFYKDEFAEELNEEFGA